MLGKALAFYGQLEEIGTELKRNAKSFSEERRAERERLRQEVEWEERGTDGSSSLESSLGGLKEAPKAGKPHTPYVEGPVVRQRISRTNDFKQAGELYRAFEKWERDDLILNLVTALKQCNPDIQARMVASFTKADPEYGKRVREGLQS